MQNMPDLEKMLTNGHFRPFIEYIVFPHFKNMEMGARINFDYPITAIVGPNGTNKSSILRALQGAPAEENIGNYWFETALDKIDMKAGGRQRYYYGYSLPSGRIAEVLQTRIERPQRGPDYFETHAPSLSDGMNPLPLKDELSDSDSSYLSTTRWSPIKKKVIYLDFRQELPAYDIYTSFNWRNQNDNMKSKKDYIRLTAPRVREALDNLEKERVWHGSNRILSPAVKLSDREVETISKILGRSYTEIRLVQHEFFRVVGYTAQLSTRNQEYSEAYAGSGEFATIMLVHRIFNTPEYSLVLLDEPETSLHPGAQKALIDFLIRITAEKKLQIIMATHAPAIVEALPPKAIKILDIDPHSHHVVVCAQEAFVTDAFTRLGASYEEKTIIVEDRLAKEIITSVAQSINHTCSKTIKVTAYGGSSTIINNLIPTQAALGSNCTIFLDGDQRPQNPISSISNIPDNELENQLKLYGIAKPRSLARSGGNDPASEKNISDIERSTLNWIHKHVRYLPSQGNPETFLLELLEDTLYTNQDAKKRWKERAAEFYHRDIDTITGEDIFETQKKQLADLIYSENISEIEELKNQIIEILAQYDIKQNQ